MPSVMQETQAALENAVAHAKRAYEFSPGTYTHATYVDCRHALKFVTGDNGVHWVAVRMSQHWRSNHNADH